jgi:hypothetical protein
VFNEYMVRKRFREYVGGLIVGTELMNENIFSNVGSEVVQFGVNMPRGLDLCIFAISSAPELSSNTRKRTLVIVGYTLKP